MRRVLIVVAVLMLLAGLTWILQGINVLGGSPMSGDPFWARAGAVVFAVGLALGLFAIFRGRPSAGR